MNIIKSRYIWILTVLVTAFISPVRGQNSAGSNIVSRTVLSSGGAVAEQRVYDNGLGDVIQEVQSWSDPTLHQITGSVPMIIFRAYYFDNT